MKMLKLFAINKPLTFFIVLTMSIGLPSFFLPILFEIDVTPFKLGVTVFVLLGSAVFISFLRGGISEVKTLFSGITKWRFRLVQYAVVLGAFPLLSLFCAVVTNQFLSPEKGWMNLIGMYLFMTIIFGMLLLNLWEETAWTGFVQSRLMKRHGLFIGSLLTAIPFIFMHLPLTFELKGFKGTSPGEFLLNAGVLIVVGVCFRFIAGKIYLSTSKSILAVGLLHASFNASGSLTAVKSQWPSVFAVVLLASIFCIYELFKIRSRSDKS